MLPKVNENINYLKLYRLKQFQRYLDFKTQQLKMNEYNPDANVKKYLMIMACHCNTETKLNTIINNIKYFNFKCIHKIIINSKGLPYNEQLEQLCENNNISYMEVENSSYLDFGKWQFVLQDENIYKDYDYVVLTNDSFIIHNYINHFLNLMTKYNVDLYGYNDSSEIRYHFQSYLFGLKTNAVGKFLNKIGESNLTIRTQEDVIQHFELKMTDWFASNNCFLKIGNFSLEKGHNIFFTNDELYIPLKKYGLLPFTKLKRIL